MVFSSKLISFILIIVCSSEKTARVEFIFILNWRQARFNQLLKTDFTRCLVLISSSLLTAVLNSHLFAYVLQFESKIAGGHAIAYFYPKHNLLLRVLHTMRTCLLLLNK